MVKLIDPAGAASPQQLTTVGGKVFFVAHDGTGPNQLWWSDGTSQGTAALSGLNPGLTASSSPSGLTDVNGKLFFTADDGVHGTELWKSDGTATGTALVSELAPGPDSSHIYVSASFNNLLYFIDADDLSLRQSDGTAAGTTRVAIPDGSVLSTSSLAVSGGLLYFLTVSVHAPDCRVNQSINKLVGFGSGPDHRWTQ